MDGAKQIILFQKGELIMKRKTGIFFLCLLITFILFPITARADIGPKPCVFISFENMGDELCYGTLLSESRSTGPASAWDPAESDGIPEHIFTYGLDYDIWEAFVNYEDSDGYYFLQMAWQCNETKCFSWGYYPPDPFKILLYYPETDTFAISGIYESYAFDSYFSVDLNQIDSITGSQDTVLIAEKDYHYGWELISLACRIVLTILLEIGIAFLFGFREKRLIAFIAGVNIVTQVILNVKLNIIHYHNGNLSFIFYYFRYEMLVLLIETILYCVLLNKIGSKKFSGWNPPLYALTANVLSFIGGLLLSFFIPGIF